MARSVTASPSAATRSRISLSEARAEAKRILAEETLGRHRPKSITFDDAKKQFLEECEQRVKEGDLKARTSMTTDASLRSTLRSVVAGSRDITTEDIARRMKLITDAPSSGITSLVAIKVFLSWARKAPRRYIASNPCEGMVQLLFPFLKGPGLSVAARCM